MVLWINERNADFSQRFLREVTYFLEEEMKIETSALHGWSVLAASGAACSKWAVWWTTAFCSPGCTLESEAGMWCDWDTPHSGKQDEVRDDLEGWNSQLRSWGSHVYEMATLSMPTQGKKENIQIAWGLSPVYSHCEPDWLLQEGKEKREGLTYIECLMCQVLCRLFFIHHLFIPESYLYGRYFISFLKRSSGRLGSLSQVILLAGGRAGIWIRTLRLPLLPITPPCLRAPLPAEHESQTTNTLVFIILNVSCVSSDVVMKIPDAEEIWYYIFKSPKMGFSKSEF